MVVVVAMVVVVWEGDLGRLPLPAVVVVRPGGRLAPTRSAALPGAAGRRAGEPPRRGTGQPALRVARGTMLDGLPSPLMATASMSPQASMAARRSGCRSACW